jgi:hypothetical protein
MKNSKEYQMAYEYAETMDWHIDGDIDVDYYEIVDLASDAEITTNISKEVLIQAMIDYLSNAFGYEV